MKKLRTVGPHIYIGRLLEKNNNKIDRVKKEKKITIDLKV